MAMMTVFVLLLNVRNSPTAGVTNILAAMPFFMDAAISCASLFTDSF